MISSQIKKVFVGILLLMSVTLLAVPQNIVYAGIQDKIPLFKALDGETNPSFKDKVHLCVETAAAVIGLQVGIAAITSLVSVPATNATEWGQLITQTVLDCIIWSLKSEIIEDMTGQTMGWVLYGLNGNPMFIQNVKKERVNLMSQVLGYFLDTTGVGGVFLSGLCTPFKIDVQLALARMYSEPFSASCNISDIIGNARNLREMVHNIDAGGWRALFRVATDPYSSSDSAFLNAHIAIQKEFLTRKNDASAEISLGKGFFSWKTQDCYDSSNISPTAPPPNQTYTSEAACNAACTPYGRCTNVLGEWQCEQNQTPSNRICGPEKINTPGSFIADGLNKVMGTTYDLSAQADELNELIEMYLAYLLTDVLTGDQGLAGYNPEDFSHTAPDPGDTDLYFDDGNDSTAGDSAAPGPRGSTSCFEKTGVFHEPQIGSEVARVMFSLPQNTSYDRILFDMDVTHGGWSDSVPNARYELFWLVRNANKNMFGYSAINAPNAVFLRHGLGQSHGFKPRIAVNGDFVPGRTYHLAYIYQVKPTPQIELLITDKENGEQIARMTSVPDVPGINVGTQRFMADFGFATPAQSGNPTEVPTYGWKYANLKVQFVGTGETPEECSSVTVRQNPGGSPGLGGGGGGGRPDFGDTTGGNPFSNPFFDGYSY